MHKVGIYNMNLIKEKFDVSDYAKWMLDNFDQWGGN